jgi:hypothetical protein
MQKKKPLDWLAKELPRPRNAKVLQFTTELIIGALNT